MKNNKINILIIIISFSIVIIGCVFIILNHKEVKISDNKKFKETYETYNGIKMDNGVVLSDVEIPEDNPFKIKSAGEIIDILKNETALVYFGYPQSPTDRQMINVLIDAAKENEIDVIYYVDIYNIRDVYENNNTLDPTLVKEGTEAYHKILEILKDYLPKYLVKSDDIYYFDTGVKKINAPTIVAISKGKVIGYHEGLVNNKDTLTDEDKNALKEIYNKIFTDYLDTFKPCDHEGIKC